MVRWGPRVVFPAFSALTWSHPMLDPGNLSSDLRPWQPSRHFTNVRIFISRKMQQVMPPLEPGIRFNMNFHSSASLHMLNLQYSQGRRSWRKRPFFIHLTLARSETSYDDKGLTGLADQANCQRYKGQGSANLGRKKYHKASKSGTRV